MRSASIVSASKIAWSVGLVAVGVACFLSPARAVGAGLGGPAEARVELGRRLFFDPAISRSGDNSCASCHDPQHGFSDVRKLSEDDFLDTRRHSQTLLDSGDLRAIHWDGELGSVEELVTARLGVPPGRVAPGYGVPAATVAASERHGSNVVSVKDEDGITRQVDLTRLKPVADLVQKDGRYEAAFLAAYRSPGVTTARLAEAIGDFVRTIRHTESPYDRFAAGDDSAISAEAKRGFEMFRGRAGCVQCHRMTPAPAPFTDHEFHDTGIEWKSRLRAGKNPLAEVASLKPDAPGRDLGRRRVTTAASDDRAFKAPTLRDVAARGPYMHDGSIATLEDVVRHYAKGGAPADPNLDARIKKFDATDADVAAIAAFLRSLTGAARPATASEFSHRAKTTRIRLVDAENRPLAGVRVLLVPAGDALPGDSPRNSPTAEAESGSDGWLSYAPPRRTHVRLVFPEGLRAPQGEMVPDTCEHLILALPVRGRAILSVVMVAGAPAPKRLAAEWPPSRARLVDESVFDPPWARLATRVVFTLEGEATVEGKSLARYSAWVHVDAPKSASIEVPVGGRKASGEVSLKEGAETRLDLSGR